MKNGFFKGHGLGNDYIALDPADLEFKLTTRLILASASTIPMALRRRNPAMACVSSPGICILHDVPAGRSSR